MKLSIHALDMTFFQIVSFACYFIEYKISLSANERGAFKLIID